MNIHQIEDRLKNKTVGIAGCGGLGSNCAVALARVGVGKLIIADFDVIEESNLNRQYFFYDQVGQQKALSLKENIQKINPKVEVEAHDLMIDAENVIPIYQDCDVIVEAFDRAEMKQMIIEAVCEDLPNKHLITGLGVAGWGNNNAIHCRQVDNLFICGDEGEGTTADIPPLAPKVGIVANMQANVVLEILLKD